MLVSMLVLFFRLRPYPSIKGGRELELLIESEGEFSNVQTNGTWTFIIPVLHFSHQAGIIRGSVIKTMKVKIVPASLSHFSSSGLSLHMFLKLRFRASKREMVVWLKSFPYSFPIARPTSPCGKTNTHTHTFTIISQVVQVSQSSPVES